MASTVGYMEFVMDALSRVNLDLRFHRMFGEYCIYANDKPIMFIFSDMVCVKRHPAIEDVMRGSRLVNPFENNNLGGDKVWEVWLLDIERNDIEEIVYKLSELLPMPKPKNKKLKK